MMILQMMMKVMRVPPCQRKSQRKHPRRFRRKICWRSWLRSKIMKTAMMPPMMRMMKMRPRRSDYKGRCVGVWGRIKRAPVASHACAFKQACLFVMHSCFNVVQLDVSRFNKGLPFLLSLGLSFPYSCQTCNITLNYINLTNTKPPQHTSKHWTTHSRITNSNNTIDHVSVLNSMWHNTPWTFSFNTLFVWVKKLSIIKQVTPFNKLDCIVN